MPRFLRLQEGWITVGLLALLLFSVTLSIQQAQWADGLVILTPVTIIGLLSGIVLAKVMHGVTVIALLVFGWAAGFGWPYVAGVVAGAAILAWEHRLVKPGDLSRLNAAFFTANGIVSIVVFLGALGDRIL